MVKVLVIDDDPDMRTVMHVLLQKHGFAVDTAAREEEVFHKIAQFKPQLILLDVLLSGADGRTICRQIKADSQMAHIPVVMCSAHPGAAVRADYGADDFIAKPFTADHLIQTINRHIQA